MTRVELSNDYAVSEALAPCHLVTTAACQQNLLIVLPRKQNTVVLPAPTLPLSSALGSPVLLFHMLGTLTASPRAPLPSLFSARPCCAVTLHRR